MFIKFSVPLLYILISIFELSSALHLQHPEETSYVNPYAALPNIPLARHGFNFYNAIANNASRAAERYNPYSVKEIVCRYKQNNKIQICDHGTYTNDCGHEDCYRGVGENCDDSRANLPNNGKCAPDLYCVCGECTGCQNEYCRLELCKRNGFYEKKQANNFIGSDYYYL